MSLKPWISLINSFCIFCSLVSHQHRHLMFGLYLFSVGCFQFLISLDSFLQDFQTFLLLRFDIFRDPLQIIFGLSIRLCKGRNCLLAASKVAFSSFNDRIFDLPCVPWHVRENFPQFVVCLDLLIDLGLKSFCAVLHDCILAIRFRLLARCITPRDHA